MVIDTSALVSILLAEPDAPSFIEAIASADTRVMSSASWVELAIVMLAKRGPDGLRELDLLIARGEVEVIPFTKEMAQLARDAYRKFGRGRHPANLNYGDCFSYATARWLDMPLLFKGDDFSETDVRRLTLHR